MNTKAFKAFPQSQVVVSGADVAVPDMLDRLCEEAKLRQDPELIARIGEVKGLYTGYDTVNNPELANALIVRLGLIVEYLMEKASFDPHEALQQRNRTDLHQFLQLQREQLHKVDLRIHSREQFIGQFDRYLELQGKKEQTRKIYRGKAKTALEQCPLSLPIHMPELVWYLREVLASDVAKADHNLRSALSKLYDYINALLGQ